MGTNLAVLSEMSKMEPEQVWAAAAAAVHLSKEGAFTDLTYMEYELTRAQYQLFAMQCSEKE